MTNFAPAWMESLSPTMNYAMFKLDERNRPIDEMHVERLKVAIANKNLLREYPIVVDRNMVVLDGQHRLRAAQSLNIPIFYTISEQATIEDIAATNFTTMRWNLDQYMHHWCSVGKPEYLKLRALCEKFPFLPLSSAIILAGTKTKSNYSEQFREGHFTAGSIPFAEMVCEACMDFKPYVSFWSSVTFIRAINQMLSYEEYDHARMMVKMQHVSTKLVKCSTVETYLSVFTEIYNWKVRVDAIVELDRLYKKRATSAYKSKI